MVDKKNKRETELEQHLAELTADLKRVQADFVNYRTRMDEERARTTESTKAATILRLLPVIDNIERALGHIPEELSDNQWVKGVAALGKSLEKVLGELGLVRIKAIGRPFDPNLHEAISAEGEGDSEVVAEELRAGYMMNSDVIRHSLVKVERRAATQEPPELVHKVLEDAKAADESDEIRGED